jgi:hypothetical protein
MRSNFSRYVALTILGVCLTASAQKSSQTPQTTGNSPSGSQQSQSSPSGITSGNAPIEATAFAYVALDADAGQIVATTKNKAAGKVVVTTPTDLSNLLQWRAVMAQAGYLQKRLNTITTTVATTGVGSLKPSDLVNSGCVAPAVSGLNPNATPGAKPVGPTVGAAATTSSSSSGPVWPAELQAVSQALGSVAGLSQSLSSSAGNMTDQPLIDNIAERLGASATVYIPSLQAESILDASDLGTGPLGTALTNLEIVRGNAINQSEILALYLPDWQTAAANVNCPPDKKTLAQGNVANWKPLFDLLNAAISSVDAFETSLFAGQNTPYQPQATSASTQGGVAPSNVAGQQTGQTGGNQGAQGQGQTQGQGSQSQQPGSILQQILPADLLFKALGQHGLTSADNVHFLSVHALESGGSLLTKTHSVFGNSFTSLYFSGGSMAEFTLFNSDGAVECSGSAVAYLGYVKPEDMVVALKNEKNELGKHMVVKNFSSCH